MQSMPISPKTIQIFYSYTTEDEEWQKKLEKQLSGSKHDGSVSHWHHGLIAPGNERQIEIDEHLNTANIFLLLISPDFMSSDHCMNVEVKKAFERHEKKEAHIIPVILRSIGLKKGKLNDLQLLPRNGTPVGQWKDPENALFHVAEEISRVIDNFIAREWLKIGTTLHEIKSYNDALKAFENALKYDARSIEVYNRKGDTCYAQHTDDEALKAYESAKDLDPRSTWAWYGIGNVYLRQRNYEKALDAFQRITEINPTTDAWSAQAWYKQGKLHMMFKRTTEAIVTYENAIRTGKKTEDRILFHRDKGYLYETLERYAESLAEAEKVLSLYPEDVSSYRDKGFALNGLGRYDEALEAYEEAIRRKPDYSSAHKGKAAVLKNLRKYQEALQEIEEAISLDKDYMYAWDIKKNILKCLAQQAREEAERYDKLAQEASEKAKDLGYIDS